MTLPTDPLHHHLTGTTAYCSHTTHILPAYYSYGVVCTHALENGYYYWSRPNMIEEIPRFVKVINEYPGVLQAAEDGSWTTASSDKLELFNIVKQPFEANEVNKFTFNVH